MTTEELNRWQVLFATYDKDPARVEELKVGAPNSPVQVWGPLSLSTGFDRGIECYRILPEKRFRAWTAEEVPVGRVIRRENSKQAGYRCLILGVGRDADVFVTGTSIPIETILSKWVLEMPDGTTAPCGVEVTDAQD